MGEYIMEQGKVLGNEISVVLAGLNHAGEKAGGIGFQGGKSDPADLGADPENIFLVQQAQRQGLAEQTPGL